MIFFPDIRVENVEVTNYCDFAQFKQTTAYKSIYYFAYCTYYFYITAIVYYFLLLVFRDWMKPCLYLFIFWKYFIYNAHFALNTEFLEKWGIIKENIR